MYMKKVAYLGPAGATFSEIAYEFLASRFGAPRLSDRNTERILTQRNEEVIPLVFKHKSYGVIAMEAKAGKRVDQSTNSFIELLSRNGNCGGIQIIGAVRMRIHFALMARQGVSPREIAKIAAHPEALGACRASIEKWEVKEIIEMPSNGKAAEEVAQNDEFALAAALGPRTAAKKYGLTILSYPFEDGKAVTTFFLLGPEDERTTVPGDENRGLIVFQAKHQPGSLVSVLTPFAQHKINLSYVHTLYVGNGEYFFAIQTECGRNQIFAHLQAVEKAKKFARRCLEFGPFPIVDA
ncbi:MAG: hypothetical protein A3B25_01200 [Candidatus Ryanbacteria bacterium RIFCSPLOWO2_01_FULL_48_26]|uniref:prephenate dehydratase n=1 Tax=Candidatus Ryanbacteria bacterium RIFCSPLOWO2_01_FULL_48_26 TaxID=1802126 RepID=A0A1G2GSR5_9BACT|nr:MAG: hypothetical protein A3B25_01200 [Candidatus Ryanbacteria bacterium RIFCSPLOWO2_01_FULL_48_26]